MIESTRNQHHETNFESGMDGDKF